jgi:hypothetical protein
MNEQEIELLQIRLHEINSFFPYEKNSYHYLYNRLFHTSYPYDKGFKASPSHHALYHELIQYKRFYSIEDTCLQTYSSTLFLDKEQGYNSCK